MHLEKPTRGRFHTPTPCTSCSRGDDRAAYSAAERRRLARPAAPSVWFAMRAPWACNDTVWRSLSWQRAPQPPAAAFSKSERICTGSCAGPLVKR